MTKLLMALTFAVAVYAVGELFVFIVRRLEKIIPDFGSYISSGLICLSLGYALSIAVPLAWKLHNEQVASIPAAQIPARPKTMSQLPPRQEQISLLQSQATFAQIQADFWRNVVVWETTIFLAIFGIGVTVVLRRKT